MTFFRQTWRFLQKFDFFCKVWQILTINDNILQSIFLQCKNNNFAWISLKIVKLFEFGLDFCVFQKALICNMRPFISHFCLLDSLRWFRKIFLPLKHEFFEMRSRATKKNIKRGFSRKWRNNNKFFSWGLTSMYNTQESFKSAKLSFHIYTVGSTSKWAWLFSLLYYSRTRVHAVHFISPRRISYSTLLRS